MTMINENLDLTDKANLALTQRDFTHMAQYYKCFKDKGAQADWIAQPDNLVRKTKDKFKMLHYCMIAAIFGWKEVQEGFAAKLKSELGIDKYDAELYGNYLISTANEWKPFLEHAQQILDGTITEAIDQYDDLDENVEKHEVLNPRLYGDDKKLKDDVREHILEIVNAFVEELEQDGINILINDILIIGSNANYNYTEDSDLDVHIMADTDALKCPDNLYPAIYNAYRSLFNKKFDITLYGTPVELFVETGDMPTVSNGIYSVKNNEWVKEPKHEAIPDIDKQALGDKVAKWKERADKIILETKDDKANPQVVYDEIDKYIEDLYELRKNGLKDGDEYSIDNLTFKEIRSMNILDDLKALKDKMTSKTLSLESLKEELKEKFRNQCRINIARVTGEQPIVQSNGYFFIYNVKESEIDNMIAALQRQAFVKYARKGAHGKYDFSHVLPNKLPTRLFTVEGKIKDQPDDEDEDE